jgi:hypothetical protein
MFVFVVVGECFVVLRSIARDRWIDGVNVIFFELERRTISREIQKTSQSSHIFQQPHSQQQQHITKEKVTIIFSSCHCSSYYIYHYCKPRQEKELYHRRRLYRHFCQNTA